AAGFLRRHLQIVVDIADRFNETAAFRVARHNGRFSRFAALDHPFPGVQQQIAFEFFCRSAVTLVTMLDEHRPDVLLEELVGFLVGRRGQACCRGQADAQTEHTSQAALPTRTQHNWSKPKLDRSAENDKACRPCPPWYRRVREDQRSPQASACAAVPSLPDPRGGRWPDTSEA